MKELVVILVLIIKASGNGSIQREYPMPDFRTCQLAVEVGKIEVGSGDENEQVGALFCAHRVR